MSLTLPRLIACLVVLLHWASAAPAQEPASDLYQAQAVTSGTMPARRDIGFALCLRQVLVKVSGDPRLAEDPRTAALADRAGEYIADFSFRDRLTGVAIHDEQGSYDRPHDLTCIFDATKINAALVSLGSRPWPLPRPEIVVALSVRDMKGRSWTLTDEAVGQTEADMRLSLLASAPRFGLNVRLARAGKVEPAGEITSDDRAPGGNRRDVWLSGSLDWSDEALGWIATWSLVTETGKTTWRVAGVGFDDAFRNGLAGAAQVLSGNGIP